MTEDLLREGEELYAQGRLDEAAQVFHAVLRTNARQAVALNNLGVIAFQQNRPADAVSLLMRAVEADPRYLEAAVNLAEIMRAAERLHELVPLFSTLVARNPHSQPVMDLLVEARRSAASRRATPEPDTDHPIRVLHGTYEVGNQMHTISRGLRRLGVKSDTVCYWPTYMKYPSDHVLDVESIGDHADAVRRTAQLAENLIAQYDVFHFHFGATLTLDFSDLPRIAEAGKKMVMHHWGSEVRTLARATALNRYAKVKVTDEDSVRRTLELLARRIPDCIVSDPGLEPFVADYYKRVHFMPPVLDLAAYRLPRAVTRGKPVVAHAPTAPGIKGTEALKRAANSLHKHVDFDLRLIQGVPHAEALAGMAQADLVVDQLHLGSHGIVAIEAMALGKAVVCWISDFTRPRYPSELPVVSANPDTIEEVLGELLSDRSRLEDLGRQGRAYVEKHHDIAAVAPRFLELYRQL